MTLFKIISMENFDSIFGLIKKGDEINCINCEDIHEAKRFCKIQYGPKGEDIKIKIVEVIQ